MPGPSHKPPTPRWLDIVVHDLHVDLKIAGVTMMHSEDYADAAKARRAARSIIWAINYRPARLIYWYGRMGSMKQRVTRVRRLVHMGRTFAIPTEVGV